jgi:hypothetical protein
MDNSNNWWIGTLFMGAAIGVVCARMMNSKRNKNNKGAPKSGNMNDKAVRTQAQAPASASAPTGATNKHNGRKGQLIMKNAWAEETVIEINFGSDVDETKNGRELVGMALEGNLAQVTALIEAGADVNSKNRTVSALV